MARQPDDKAAAKFSSEDSALVRELALLLDETSLTEIEIERAGLRVRVARTSALQRPCRSRSRAAPAGGRRGGGRTRVLRTCRSIRAP